MRTKKVLGALICALAACGAGDQPVNTGGTSPGALEQAHGKVPASKLGHYRSPDGSVGLVLDRTGDKPKVRVDGGKDIVEVFVEDEVRAGAVVARKYRGPDGKVLLRVEAQGDVELYRNAGTARLVRDGDAEPLGAPTQVGISPPP